MNLVDAVRSFGRTPGIRRKSWGFSDTQKRIFFNKDIIEQFDCALLIYSNPTNFGFAYNFTYDDILSDDWEEWKP